MPMNDEQHKSDVEPPKISHITTVKLDSYTHESISVEDAKQTDAFSRINRGISDEDLQSPITARWLLSEHDKYDTCVKELDRTKTAFHEKDKECAVVQAKLKTNTSFEMLYSCSLSMGSALLGAFITFDGDIKWLSIAIGVILTIGSVVAKLVIEKNEKKQ